MSLISILIIIQSNTLSIIPFLIIIMASDKQERWNSQIRIEQDVADAIMQRQNWKCYNCSESFAPPNPINFTIRQIKPRNEGGGYHNHKQLVDYGNLGFYCDVCYREETVSVAKNFRIKQVKLEQYKKWMDGNPRFTTTDSNGRTKYNFSKFVKTALEKLTDEEWFEMLAADNQVKLDAYESEAESFLEILKMYNDRVDDLDFINKVVHLFQHYTPPVRTLSTDEQIDASTDDPKLRTFLKEVRNAEIRYISERKQAGYLHYETNSRLFKE